MEFHLNHQQAGIETWCVLELFISWRKSELMWIETKRKNGLNFRGAMKIYCTGELME